MSFLVFCSFEVGGLPFRMADILNRHGFRTYYVSIHLNPSGHDSTAFHHQNSQTDWNLTSEFSDIIESDENIILKLKAISTKYSIKGCIATGAKSFLLYKSGISYHYWSFGADLDQICFYNKWPETYGIARKFLTKIIKSRYRHVLSIEHMKNDQIESILRSESIIIAPYQAPSYYKICPAKPKSFFPHFFIGSDYETVNSLKSVNKKSIKNRIGTEKFFFSSTRHFWFGTNREYSDNKGNDVIIRSFKRYLEMTGDVESKLVMIAKGPDVGASVTLVEALKLVDRVVWLNEMTRDELKTYYSAAHVVFGQFGTPVLAFSALEPLTEATPCISLFLDGKAESVPFYKNVPPILNANDLQLIAEHLVQLVADEEKYRKLSYESWQWIQDNCLEMNFANSILSIFNTTQEFVEGEC